jgi:hypothetical protein
MRALVFLCCGLAAFLAGCESTSFSDRLRERFSAVPPKTLVVAGESRDVYFAVQTTFKRLDYVLTRSNVSDLRVEAASRINTSTVFRDSRQIVASVELAVVGPNQVEVSLRLLEAMEAPGVGGPSELPLREHGFYETYFAALEQVLREQAANAAAKKN